MELIKGFVVTLVTTLIFITAVEIIGPDNSMKKYLKFVMGLILISVILNPIISFFTNGESIITSAIDKYENDIFKESDDNEEESESGSLKQTSFKENFNRNCVNLLSKEYKNMDFKCDIDCNVDFQNPNLVINEVKVGVKDKGIRKVQNVKKVDINDTSEEEIILDETLEKVRDFLSDELSVDKEKIIVYYI